MRIFDELFIHHRITMMNEQFIKYPHASVISKHRNTQSLINDLSAIIVQYIFATNVHIILYRRSGNFRVIKFSYRKISCKNFFMDRRSNHENFLRRTLTRA